MTADTARPRAFASELAQSDLIRDGTSVDVAPDGSEAICYVAPPQLDAVDDMATEYGLERVDGELTRRTYAPAN